MMKISDVSEYLIRQAILEEVADAGLPVKLRDMILCRGDNCVIAVHPTHHRVIGEFSSIEEAVWRIRNEAIKGSVMTDQTEYEALLEEFLRWVPCDREDSPIYDLRQRVEAALAKGGA